MSVALTITSARLRMITATIAIPSSDRNAVEAEPG
jgi:hypothetical protein